MGHMERDRNGVVSMSTSDELLFGNEPTSGRDDGRDSDGDGVSDAQEGLDGTDAHDASSALRHDAPVVRPDTHDPRGDLERASLEREVIIDVAANNPTAISLEQSLPTGLDGQSLTTARHYGNADADQFMGGRVDENSPLNMERNPLGSGQAGPGTQHGAGGLGTAPPLGAVLGSRAPNINLVGADLPEYEEPDDGGGIIEWVKDLFTPEPAWPGPGMKEFVPPTEPAPEHVPLPPQRGPKMGSVDPDAGGGGDGDIERAVLLAGADTDPIRGDGAPQIEDGAPPPLARDLVTDRNPDGDGTEIDTSTAVATPPGGFFTDGVNPDADFGTGLAPSPGGAGGGGGGQGGDGRQSASYSATAADAEAPPDDTPANDSTSRGIFTVEGDAPRHADSDGDGVSDAQERFEGTDPNNAADFIRQDVPTAGPTTGDPRGDLNEITQRPDPPVDVLATTPTGLSVDQALPVGLDGAAIPTRHTYGNADADQLLHGRIDENSPLNIDRSPFGTTEVHHDGGLLSTAPPGVELNFNAPNNNLAADTDGGTKETPEEKYKRESGFPKYDNAEDIVKNRESNKAQKEADDWAKKTAPKTMSDPDAAGGGSIAPTGEEVAHAVAIAAADTDFVRGYGGAPQIEGDPPPAHGSLVTDPSPDGDGTAVDTSTVVATPPGGFFTDGVNPDAGFGTDLAPSQGGAGTGGGDDGGRQGTNYAATAADATGDIDESGGVSVVEVGASGGGIHSIGDVTGLSTGGAAIESTDAVGRSELNGRPGDVEAESAPIVPETDRPLPEIEALEPLDPVAAAMLPTAELSVEVPTDSFDGLAIDDSAAVPDEVDLDDGF